jgi:uncharacterized membrane protein
MARVLIAGESWTTHTIHQKGFDSFTTTAYEEGVGPLRDALEANGHTVTYQPAHVAAAAFPATEDELRAFDVIVLSDIGANTLLLHPDTFARSQPRPDRLEAIRRRVEGGGGLVMIGGYLTFQGIDGRARYAGTPVEAALPVVLSTTDDRQEAPAGIAPRVTAPAHPIVRGLDPQWPDLLGYNRASPRGGADVIAYVGADPLLAAWEYGSGRAVAFASDCGPHWAPPAFLDWPGYAPLWSQLVAWCAREGRP